MIKLMCKARVDVYVTVQRHAVAKVSRSAVENAEIVPL